MNQVIHQQLEFVFGDENQLSDSGKVIDLAKRLELKRRADVARLHQAILNGVQHLADDASRLYK